MMAIIRIALAYTIVAGGMCACDSLAHDSPDAVTAPPPCSAYPECAGYLLCTQAGRCECTLENGDRITCQRVPEAHDDAGVDADDQDASPVTMPRIDAN